MLGLGLALSIGKRVLGDAIDSLLSALRGRATYYENGSASKSTIKAIDDADILDKASILLTPTATSNARVHSVKTYTGDELVTNGAFDTDSDWSLGTGWSIANGKASSDGTQVGNSSLSQSSVLPSASGKTYKITFTISNYVNGSVQVYPTNTTVGTYPKENANGTYTRNVEVTSATPNDILYIQADADFIGSIDNVSVIDVSSDFDFDRASSATRINSDGLVQDMQSITDPELVLNGDFEELGDEEVTDGDFPNLDNWSVNGGDYATIVDGALNSNNTENGNWHTENISQNISFVNGKTYKISFKAKNISGGVNLRLTQNGYVIFTDNITSSFVDYEVYYTANADNGSIRIFCNDAIGEFQIDNISVQQVDPNDRWSLGTGWSIEDGKVTSIGSNYGQQLKQTILQTNKIYKLSFDIVDYTSGNIALESVYYGETQAFNGIDSYVAYFTSLSQTEFRLYSQNFIGSIDNISVKDITFSEEVDLARINYDSNGENGHILLEPTSTNLVTYSEDFSEWALVNGTILPNATASPSGEINADKFTFISGYAQLRYTLTVASSTQYSASFYVKNLDATNVEYRVYDVTNGTDILSSSYYSQISNTEWTRVSFEFNTSATTSSIYFYPIAGSYSGSLYIWGAQVEALSYATSYIPTLTGSTVTRATETLTGSGNSTLINSTEGVLYAEIAALAEDGIKKYISLSDGSINNDVRLYFDTNGYISALSKVGGSTQVFIQSNAYTQTDFNKVAFKYKVNDFALWINGVEVATDNSGTTNTANSLDELNFNGNNLNFYGKCKAVAVFNEALSDTELTNLTS